MHLGCLLGNLAGLGYIEVSWGNLWEFILRQNILDNFECQIFDDTFNENKLLN